MPIHKKNNRQCFENYHPVSLQPICGKILERLIFNEMFPFFIKSGLISQNHSAFKPGDSCVNQLCLLRMRYTNYLMMDLMLEVSF